MATRITQDELLEAVTAVMRPLPAEKALTVNELVELSDRSKPTILAMLRKIKNQGRLEVLKVPRESIDGRITLVAGYRLKSMPKKK